MIRPTSLAFLFLAAGVSAQPKEAVEAFRFDPVPGLLQPAEGTAKVIQAIAYSPDGKQLAVAGEGGEITLWNVAEHTVAGRLVGHTDTVYAVAWSKDGKRLASSSGDKTAIVWDVPLRNRRTRRRIRAASMRSRCHPMARRSPPAASTRRYAYGMQRRESSSRDGKGHTASVRCLAFNPNGAGIGECWLGFHCPLLVAHKRHHEGTAQPYSAGAVDRLSHAKVAGLRRRRWQTQHLEPGRRRSASHVRSVSRRRCERGRFAEGHVPRSWVGQRPHPR